VPDINAFAHPGLRGSRAGDKSPLVFWIVKAHAIFLDSHAKTAYSCSVRKNIIRKFG